MKQIQIIRKAILPAGFFFTRPAPASVKTEDQICRHWLHKKYGNFFGSHKEKMKDICINAALC
jgi:hypothetical protein